MADESEPREQPPEQVAPTPSGRIFDLTEEERDLLREFAERLRDHSVRNPVAREALDRAADELERAAALPQN